MRSVLAWTLTVAAALPFGGTAHRRTEEGNRLYEAGRYDDALRAYTDAQLAAPDLPELIYDIGNVLYRKEDLAGAEDAFRRALASASPDVAARAAYNLGNTLFRQDRFDDAAEAYRRSLELDPDRADAKRNLELALLRARQQRQPPSDSESRSDSGEGEGGQDDSPSAKDAGSEAPDDGEPTSGGAPPRPSDGTNEGEESGDSDSSSPSPDDGAKRDGQPGRGRGEGMTREQAERLLDGLEGEERESLRRLVERTLASEGPRREKDW